MKTVLITLAIAASATTALAEQGQPGSHFIESWDVDGDGSVSLSDIETRRDDVFYMFDNDDNGALDAEEYGFFDETRAADMENNAGHGPGMRRADTGMTLSFNDTDGDGAVTRAEFLAHSADWMALLDRDGDGQVTSADFGRN